VICYRTRFLDLSDYNALWNSELKWLLQKGGLNDFCEREMMWWTGNLIFYQNSWPGCYETRNGDYRWLIKPYIWLAMVYMLLVLETTNLVCYETMITICLWDYNGVRNLLISNCLRWFVIRLDSAVYLTTICLLLARLLLRNAICIKTSSNWF
jgi:hypothetical protein